VEGEVGDDIKILNYSVSVKSLYQAKSDSIVFATITVDYLDPQNETE